MHLYIITMVQMYYNLQKLANNLLQTHQTLVPFLLFCLPIKKTPTKTIHQTNNNYYLFCTSKRQKNKRQKVNDAQRNEFRFQAMKNNGIFYQWNWCR